MSLYGPPDVEPAVVSLLTRDGVWTSTRYPSSSEDERGGVIRVNATGGSLVDRVVTVQRVLVECWHDDAAAAWELASWAQAVLTDAPFVDTEFDFKHVSADMPNNNPDVNRPGMVRFQFLSTIHSRTVPLEAS